MLRARDRRGVTHVRHDNSIRQFTVRWHCEIPAKFGAILEGVQSMSIDRSEVSRALAKALAFKACGKQAEAEEWARELVRLLECADILKESDTK